MMQEADLLDWPEGMRPAKGTVTKSALAATGVEELRVMAARKGLDANGTKKDLIWQLYEVVQLEWQLVGEYMEEEEEAQDFEYPQQVREWAEVMREELMGPGALQEDRTSVLDHAESVPEGAEAEGARLTQEYPPLQQGQPGRNSSRDDMQMIRQDNAVPEAASSGPDDDDLLQDCAALDVSGSGVEDDLLLQHDTVQEAASSAADDDDLLQDCALPQTGESREADDDALLQHRRLSGATASTRMGSGGGGGGGGSGGEVRCVLEKLVDEGERVLEAASGMQLSVLGSACGAAAAERNPCSLALRVHGEVWVFDAPDDVQRQVMRMAHIKPSKTTRIFVGSLSGECLWGLAGLVCTVGASRVRGHAKAEMPLHLYGPPGLAQYLATVLALSDTFVLMPVLVHELVAHPVPEDALTPKQLNFRGKIWRVPVPPDQYNPFGFCNGDLKSIELTTKRRSWDRQANTCPRAGWRPLPLPPPGDPAPRRPLPPWDLSWTIWCNSSASVTAAAMKHPTPSFGWVVQEASRAGNLDVDAAQALGVTPGPAFNELKSGLPVVNPLGEVIAPEMVVSPDRPGRRVALIGRTADARGALRLAHRADLLVHDACCLAADEPAALARGRCSARMAGQFARQVDAAHLLLTSIGQQFDSSGAPECSVEQLEREAGDAFGRPAAALEDLQVWDLSRKEPSS